MNAADLTIYAVIIILLAALIYILGVACNKFRAHGGKVWLAFTPLPHVITLPQMDYSEYWEQDNNGMRFGDYSGMWPTIDDEKMIELAGMLKKKISKKSRMGQARYLLAMVQQNVTYVKDIDNYGQSEFWAFPATTIRRAKGDCEDSAFIFACLAYLLGLDVVLINVVGHMTCGVAGVKPLTSSREYPHNGKVYYDCDAVNTFPFIGRGSSAALVRIIDITEPSEDFKARMIKKG